MKKTYRLYRRNGGAYYLHHNTTGKQRSLKTTDEAEALKMLHAENEIHQNASLNLELGKAYLRNADPKLVERTWQDAINELSTHGIETSQKRYARGFAAKEFDIIRHKPIIETTADDLKEVLKKGGNITNNFLRRLHNFALENGWMHWFIISAKKWPQPKKQPKRAITLNEHEAILAAENNQERRLYYQMLWLIGAAQTDCAMLTAENFDLEKRVLKYQRKKTGEWSSLQIGPLLEALLQQLPQKGFLFPKVAQLQDKHRSAEFWRRCRLLKIKGISLHSYRYAWAERAYKHGYPERFAQAALGHSSRAVHHAYAKNAVVVCPALEESRENILPMNEPIASREEDKAEASSDMPLAV
jgi:integrase